MPCKIGRVKQHDELVTAPAAQPIAGTQAAGDDQRNLLQQFITTRMPEAIIDGLEAVHVKQQYRKRPILDPRPTEARDGSAFNCRAR